MDASSTRRARLTKLALCTGAVLAVAAFTGEARADNGLSALVSGTVSDPISGPVSGPVSGVVEQLPAPAAEPLAEVISTVAPTVDAVPPTVNEVVADVTHVPANVAGAAIPGLPEQTGSRSNESGTGAEPGPRASSTPDAAAPVAVSAPIAAEAAAGSAAGASAKVVRASRPSPGLTSPASNAPPPRPGAGASQTPFSQVLAPVSRDLAPAAQVAWIPVADSRPAHTTSQAPPSPLPASSELPGFDALLPPLAAFALLLALPLGFFMLTAQNALGAGLQPAVAALRSADVRFRLVRPG